MKKKVQDQKILFSIWSSQICVLQFGRAVSTPVNPVQCITEYLLTKIYCTT